MGVYTSLRVFKNKVRSPILSCKFNIHSLNLWENNLDIEIKRKIEKHWRNNVLNRKTDSKDRITYYVLPMFPYPSGNLHMGHVRVYSISDTMARFQKLCGTNVIQPIGWDAFGLPAENAAFEHKVAPAEWTKTNIASMKEQLQKLAFDFDWNREISTNDPAYFKWTQYIFLKLLEHGLAYQSKASVNWDPVDKTVLADEQVDDEGCSWRSGAKVEKKILKQWFIRTTAYAKQLYEGLSSDKLENWGDIINLQKHWIGECNGVVVTFTIDIGKEQKNIDIWTADPHKFVSAEFLLMKTNNPIALEIHNEQKGLLAYNPIICKQIPVFITDHANYPEGRDFYLGSASADPNDRTLALSLNMCVENSLSSDKDADNVKAINIAKSKKIGGYFVSSKLKDWLISRQRYWGTPIPVINCHHCGTVPVPYEELPVELPAERSQPLANQESWINCRCPKCQSDARRETDTMDTFVDSSWYYYRFLDPHNKEKPFDSDKLIGTTPVHLYIGGKEHAVLHLYYARFISYFLHSIGLTPHPEPFKKLIVQGMVMGQSYKLKSCGKYIPPENVYQEGKIYKEKGTNEPVLVQWEKMSKSKYNGENPERLLSKYGCDTTRLFILADVPPSISRNWSDATFPGVLNWQHRLWLTIKDLLTHRNNTQLMESSSLSPEQFAKYEKDIWDSKNFTIVTSTYIIKYTQKLSVAISRLQTLTTTLRKNLPPEVIARSAEYELALASLIIMLSPMAPHFCCELWAGLLSAPHRINQTNSWIDWTTDVHQQTWPRVDENYTLSFSCKVDGKDICDLRIKPSELPKLTKDKALSIMLKEENVIKRTARGIQKVDFLLYPECRAIIKITTVPKLKNVISVNKAC